MLLHLRGKLIYSEGEKLLNNDNKIELQDAAAVLPGPRSVLWRMGASQELQHTPWKTDVSEKLCFSPHLSNFKWSAS